MKRVLVVDDDAAGLEIRRLILERRGYSVTKAADAAQARAAFSPEAFDVVLLDVRLPRIEDGLGLIREFRSASPDMRIVVLCGNRGDLDGREESSMVDAIVSKPARTDALVNAIAGL